MVSPKSKKLTDLKNIGAKIASRLNEVGINSEAKLRKAGPVKAHRMIKNKYPNETLSVCYYLYSFDGALKNKHWDDIGQRRKAELKKLAGV